MIGGRTFIRMDTHEELAHLGELANERRIPGDGLLDGFVVAKLPKVTEDWHEALGLERETIHIQFCDLGIVCRSVDYTFVGNLVREEVDDDIKQMRDKIMVPHDMTCN